MTLTFARTRFAAQADKGARWSLIEALEEDAESNSVRVKSAESFDAATEALSEAGNELAPKTVGDLLITAEFDHESTPRQAETWRRYGWTVIQRVAGAYNEGHWTRDEAFRFLDKAQLVTQAQVKAKIQDLSRSTADAPTLSEEWESWLTHLADLIARGAILADQTLESDAELSIQAAMGPAILERIRERMNLIETDADALDEELRQLLAVAS